MANSVEIGCIEPSGKTAEQMFELLSTIGRRIVLVGGYMSFTGSYLAISVYNSYLNQYYFCITNVGLPGISPVPYCGGLASGIVHNSSQHRFSLNILLVDASSNRFYGFTNTADSYSNESYYLSATSYDELIAQLGGA